jgi:site-specific recombinase XerD
LHLLATHLLEGGYDQRIVHEPGVSTTMIYTQYLVAA